MMAMQMNYGADTIIHFIHSQHYAYSSFRAVERRWMLLVALK